MPATYFWVDGEVVTVGSALTIQDKIVVWDVLCIDTYEEAADLKYGQFTHAGWVPVPKEEFPKEFLTTVLLLT